MKVNRFVLLTIGCFALTACSGNAAPVDVSIENQWIGGSSYAPKLVLTFAADDVVIKNLVGNHGACHWGGNPQFPTGSFKMGNTVTLFYTGCNLRTLDIETNQGSSTLTFSPN